MRCYYVLVHGELDWVASASAGNDLAELEGFYCHRYVIASDEGSAVETAFQRIRANLDKQSRWLSDGLVALRLTAEEVRTASLLNALKPDNRGHTFY